MMNTSALKKTVQNKRLLTKKDLSKMKISELRELYKMTHIIDGNLRDMRGYCFSCLTPLKADYTRFENYCLDC